MIVLGIDTSCDDTGVGIVEDGFRVHANVIASQHGFHERYGGIVPSIASRQHARTFNPVLAEALRLADLPISAIDAVAVSSDQGLALSLAIGVSGAKALALAIDRPLLGMHHVEGHIYSGLMANPDRLSYPFVCLTAAGGHTLIVLAHAHGEYELLGHTRDDAAGEAYDKIARRMGLPYPGGPVIDKLAQKGDPRAFDFPRPMIRSDSLEFSFSGLKTAVNQTIERLERAGEPLPTEDLAASFQQAVVDVLVAKTERAMQDHDITKVSVAGGVAANSSLRSTLGARAEEHSYDAFFPPLNLCVDNGAMIAGAAHEHLRAGKTSTMQLDARANAPLGSLLVKYRAASKYAP